MQQFIIRSMKAKTFEQTAGTAKRNTAALIDPALAHSDAEVDSALQGADQLPPWPGLLELGFIIPQSSCVMLLLIVSEWLLLLLGYYRFGLNLH